MNDVTLQLPARWREYFKERQLTPIRTGMNRTRVWRLVSATVETDLFLKVAESGSTPHLRSEANRTKLLSSQNIRVPTIIDELYDRELAAIVMTALPGIPADDASAAAYVPYVATALRQLHSLDVKTCPFDETTEVRLQRAHGDIERGEIDGSHFDARNAHLTPTPLLQRLSSQVPATHKNDDLVVVHGDAWLSNMISDNSGEVGFVDCGNSGRGDRYVDLAVVIESLTDVFGEAASKRFLKEYGTHSVLDASKLQFFSDLYELF